MHTVRKLLSTEDFLNKTAGWVQLIVGLLILSAGITLMLKADVGMFPWGVFQLGVSIQLNIPFGVSLQLVGLFVIILAYLVGKVKPRLGTLANMILIGFFIDYIFYPIIPFYTIFWQQIVMMVLSILMSSAGTAVYMSADLGAGPRDSLMMAFYIVTRKSLRVVRSSLKITVLIIGYFLGGKVGLGTLIFAVLSGLILQACLKLLRLLPLNLIRVDILKQRESEI